MWEMLLHITEGKLELTKCFWIPITWKWKKGKPVMVTNNKRGTDLYLKESETKEYVLIPRKTGVETIKHLGVISSCNGNWTKEFHTWLEFSGTFGTQLVRSGLGRPAGYLVYNSIWMAKFRYYAPVVGFTKPQLTKIQQRVVGKCLSVAGYSSKIQRAIVFGPMKYGCMSWSTIMVVSIYEKLKLLIGSIRLQDTVGKLLQLQITWLQLVAGTSENFLQSKVDVPYLPKGWITNLHKQLVKHDIKVVLSSIWHPTAQREENRVIMDVVRDTLPDWTWTGINSCRIFLQATTIADITTLDGTYVPEKIRYVKSALRDQTLVFPHQTRPSKQDRAQWRHFVDCISQNGHLYTSLGPWTRHPDQQFQYLYTPRTYVIYRRDWENWELFGRPHRTTRRFRRTRLTEAEPMKEGVPIRVIEGHGYILIVDRDKLVSSHFTTRVIEDDNPNTLEQRILGKYDIDPEKLEELKQQWHSQTCTIIGATDGGLKSNIGTSSYAIFLPNKEEAVVAGTSGEYQPDVAALSTRQELLGQISLEYWMHKLGKWWGVPRHSITLVLITDSQASIDIMENVGQVIGIKDTLRPNMDVALELGRIQSVNWWISRDIVKVQSHILVEQAPDEFFWYCNDTADRLATKAREVYSIEDLKKRKPLLMEGARAICCIDGQHVNNNLYSALQEKMLGGGDIRHFLLEKYGWTDSVFSAIAWDAHHTELQGYPILKRPTLIKYIHGWLATTQRRFREGLTRESGCPLCDEEDSRYHFLWCSNTHMKIIRETHWNQLLGQIANKTENGCRQVFQAGLDTIRGCPPPNENTILEWPVELQEAYRNQTTIG